MEYATSGGMYREDAESLRRLVSEDRSPTKLALDVGEVWVDRSTHHAKESSWRLPTPYVKLEYDERIFSPRPMAPVRLVAVWLNGQPSDLLFEVDQGTTNATIDADIKALLSDLKSWLEYTP